MNIKCVQRYVIHRCQCKAKQDISARLRANSLGVRLPRDSWGLCSLYSETQFSVISRTSLNRAKMYEFCVGLPGLVNSNSTPVVQPIPPAGQTPVPDLAQAHLCRVSAPSRYTVQNPDDPGRRKVRVVFDGQDLAVKIIKHVECAETLPAHQAVIHKIRRPALVDGKLCFKLDRRVRG